MQRRLVTFLTGQSDPGRNALSAEQSAFLDSLALPEGERLPLNFPWDHETAPHRDVSLAQATVANVAQFLGARRARFGARHRADLERLLARTEHLVLLAGSCGLELLRAIDPPREAWPRLHVFAYGPVAWARPEWHCHLVGGRRDPISRAFFTRPDTLVDADHMSYLREPVVRDEALAFLARVDARIRGAR